MDKRNLERFCIQFNVSDARHLQVIDILDAQGRRKAQFITEAILHYTNCSESPVMKPQQNSAILRKTVESIVREFLRTEKAVTSATHTEDYIASAETINPERTQAFGVELDAELIASIQESMGVLRGEDG